jgi:hypothetical protein
MLADIAVNDPVAFAAIARRTQECTVADKDRQGWRSFFSPLKRPRLQYQLFTATRIPLYARDYALHCLWQFRALVRLRLPYSGWQ